jgi:hypothetical protein
MGSWDQKDGFRRTELENGFREEKAALFGAASGGELLWGDKGGLSRRAFS